MRKFGCVTTAVGAMICVAGLLFYVIAGRGLANARRVTSIALPIGRAVQTDLITVDTTRLCSISVSGTVRRQRAAFTFPFRYSVLDPSGRVLSSGSVRFGSRDDAAWSSRTRLDASLGFYRHEFGSDAFAGGPPGRIRVEAQLDPDTSGLGEKVRDFTLVVYDNTTEQRRPVVAGTVLVILGIATAGFGLFKYIDGASRELSAGTGTR